MNKICTSLEESKKLLELVIDINTADMCWSVDIPDLPTLLAYPITDCDNWENKIPAWSLTALFDLFPNGSILRKSDKGKYFMFGNMFDNPLDAAFEMVCWLKENGKI